MRELSGTGSQIRRQKRRLVDATVSVNGLSLMIYEGDFSSPCGRFAIVAARRPRYVCASGMTRIMYPR